MAKGTNAVKKNIVRNASIVFGTVIIVNKDKFKIDEVECINNNISDHNPVIAEIKIM